MIKLSVIVPIGLTIDTIFRAKRLRYLVELFSKREGIEIIVVDSSRFPLSKIISSIDGISYHHIEMGSIYSASKARNFGSGVAKKGNYLLFFGWLGFRLAKFSILLGLYYSPDYWIRIWRPVIRSWEGFYQLLTRFLIIFKLEELEPKGIIREERRGALEGRL